MDGSVHITASLANRHCSLVVGLYTLVSLSLSRSLLSLYLSLHLSISLSLLFLKNGSVAKPNDGSDPARAHTSTLYPANAVRGEVDRMIRLAKVLTLLALLVHHCAICVLVLLYMFPHAGIYV